MMFQYAFLTVAAVITQASGQLPEMVVCPDIEPALWGKISCNSGVRPGSICTLSCEDYYDLAETTDESRIVICQDDGTWSASTEFKCDPIRCFPEMQTPLNGDLICSATNLAQSLCVFFCKDHYDLVGVDTDKNAYAVCKDDGNGDAIGEWSSVSNTVVFPPAFPPTCESIKCSTPMSPPENGQVICSAENFSGSTCVFYCDAGYKFKGTNEPVLFSSCRDDKNYDSEGAWTRSVAPTCQKCKRAKNVQLMALIHDSENNPKQFGAASDMITKLLITLKKKTYRIRPTVRVNRYGVGVNETTEVYTTNFQQKKDKVRIEAIPYPTTEGRDIKTALEHIGNKLEGSDRVLVAFIFTNDMMEYDEDAHQIAKELRARGVMIFVFTIPQRNRVLTWRMKHLVALAGSEDMVFNLGYNSSDYPITDVADQIYMASLKKGCAIYGRKNSK